VGTQAGEAARAYHEATKHSEESLRRTAHSLDFDNQPIPFKIYPTLEPLLLAREWSPLEVPALEALSLRIGNAGSASRRERIPELASLARVLYLSAGITKRKHYPGGEMYFRAAPNTGALYHIDLYVVCGELSDLAAGVYHFGPHDFGLRRLRGGDHRAVLVEASGGEPSLARAPVILVSTSTYWRNAWKYQARAYRHCFWDAGTLHANLLAAATDEQLPARVVTGFADRPVEQLLSLDAAREGALTLVALGTAEPPPPAPAPAPLQDLALDTAPLSRSEVDYPAIREMHGASSLATGAEAAAWREIPCRRPSPAARGRSFPADPLAAGSLPVESLESVIRRRGSTRAFERGASLSLAELATALERAAAPLPTDFGAPPSAAQTDIYLIVHAVEGMPAGAYCYSREHGALELLRTGDFRDVAGRLGLFQQLPADAAVNVYWLTDLDAVLEARGDRGYRAVQLEGGIRGGLMYLAAYALRFGATGLTFLDDEVIDFFSPHARGKSVMFLTALGRSVRRQRR
jgi:SagB-type dehydrogenase family enzyme